MVKMICDRCGKEIKGDKYYTINIFGNDVRPNYSTTVTDYASTSCLNSRESILEVLNNTKIYCKDCRDKIEKMILG